LRDAFLGFIGLSQSSCFVLAGHSIGVFSLPQTLLSSAVGTRGLANPSKPEVLVQTGHSAHGDNPLSAADCDSGSDTVIQHDIVEASLPLVPVIQSLAGNGDNEHLVTESTAEDQRSLAAAELPPPRKRARTTADKITNARAKHPIRHGCDDRCRRKCSSKFTDERRSQIHNVYWQMTYNEKRIWQSRLIKQKEVMRHRRRNSAVENESYKRTNSFCYFLPSETVANEIPVCQKFFCRHSRIYEQPFHC